MPKPEAGQEPVTDVRVATHDYFRAMGIRLIRGRVFGAMDAGPNVRRVIISDSMARRILAERGSNRPADHRVVERSWT